MIGCFMGTDRPATCTWSGISFRLFPMRSYEDCIKDSVTALAQNPQYTKAYARLAKSYLALGDLERALEAYAKAMEVAPTDRELLTERQLCKQVQQRLSG